MKHLRLFPLLTILFVSGPAVSAGELKPFEGKDDTAPPLVLEDLDGRVHDINAYRGQVVLVNFWATWCAPCIEEMPAMQRLENRMEGKPFKILAVDISETAGDIREFLERVPVEFSILIDPDGDTMQSWKVYVLPSNFLVDPDGRIRYSTLGAVEWDDDTIVEKIDALMKKPETTVSR